MPTGISWTEETWNPLAGCTKVSEGCKNCYAMRDAYRLSHAVHPKTQAAYEGLTVMQSGKPQWTNWLRMLPERLDQPLRWKRPRRIFVNSMSDLMHEGVPLSFIQEVFQVMRQAHWHQFQVLTKRSARLAEIGEELIWSPNIWMGVSVENREYAYRIDDLRSVPARVRFVSAEPLLGPLPRLNLSGIHWVIVGAESGPGARPMECDWAREIKNECVAQSVAFFMKQKATPDGRKIHLPEVDGKQWTEYPVPAGSLT